MIHLILHFQAFSDAPQKVKPLVPNSKGQEVKFLRYHPNWRINARFTAVVTAWLLTRPNVGRFSRPPSWSHSPRSPHPVSPKGALFAVLHRVLFPIIGFDITAILSPFLRFVKSAQPENCKFPRGKQEKPTRKMRMKGAATETLCFSQNNPKPACLFRVFLRARLRIMVAQKRQSAGKGGKDNGGKSSFKSAGPHKRGPYRAVCAQGGVADGGRPCGLFNGARARFWQIRAVCGGRRGGSAPFSTMWAVILGGAVGYLFPSPVDIPARYIAALLAVGAIRWSLSELKSIRDHPVFAPVTAFLPLLSTASPWCF